jgi:hypothetical protein
MIKLPALFAEDPSPPTHKYQLEGGIRIRDKTEGIAQPVFSEALTKHFNAPTYEILINKKKLLRSCCNPPVSLSFTKSFKMSFKPQDKFIKITSIDNEKGKAVLYVDQPKCAPHAYAYPYLPKALTLEEATLKIPLSLEEFKPSIGLYNEHGVAIFGTDGTGYALYWANPYEEKVKKIDIDLGTLRRGGGSTFAKSKDGRVNFHYELGRYVYLNGQVARKIPFSLNFKTKIMNKKEGK